MNIFYLCFLNKRYILSFLKNIFRCIKKKSFFLFPFVFFSLERKREKKKILQITFLCLFSLFFSRKQKNKKENQKENIILNIEKIIFEIIFLFDFLFFCFREKKREPKKTKKNCLDLWENLLYFSVKAYFILFF